MKIKAGVNFHNRFDIVKNGEWVGYAENIILNQMYNRLCNFLTYFNYIHFGTGSGTPTPDRTSLFSHLGTKEAVVEETVKAFPTSRVTKKIVLMPEEYVGRTITEVGVAYGSSASNLVTHAMIKDAEGNPLSITKTELDVIEIYATVFIKFDTSNQDVKFYSRNTNKLITYLTGGSYSDPQVYFGNSNAENTRYNYFGRFVSSASLTRSVSAAEKRVTYSTRIPINASNYDISEMGLEEICRINLEQASIWSPYTLTNVQLGVGDGVQTEFDLLRYDVSNVIVKINGQSTTNFTLANIDRSNRREKPGWMLVDPEATSVDGRIYGGCFIGLTEDVPITRIMPVDPDTIGGQQLEVTMSGGRAYEDITANFAGSYDGINFTNFATKSAYGLDTVTRIVDIPDNPYTHLRFSFSGWYGRVYRIDWINKNWKRPLVIFNTPPAVGDVITVDYTVPYIPKTENHVLDVEFSILFGEGV